MSKVFKFEDANELFEFDLNDGFDVVGHSNDNAESEPVKENKQTDFVIIDISDDDIEVNHVEGNKELMALDSPPAEVDAPYQHHPPIICHSCGQIGHIRLDPTCVNYQTDRLVRKITPKIEEVAAAVERLEDKVEKLAEMQEKLWQLVLSFVAGYYNDNEAMLRNL